jgi:hypothetical protein
VIGIAASGGSDTLSAHGFQVAMLVTGALICVGGVIGGAGIRNAVSEADARGRRPLPSGSHPPRTGS